MSVDSSIPGTGAEERHTKGSLARPLGMVGMLIIWVGWGAWRVWDLAVSNIAWLDQSVRTLRLALPDASLATKSVFVVGLTVGGIVWSLLPILFVMAWSAMASSPSDTPRRQRIGEWGQIHPFVRRWHDGVVSDVARGHFFARVLCRLDRGGWRTTPRCICACEDQPAVTEGGLGEKRRARISMPVAVLLAGILIAVAIAINGLFPRYSMLMGESDSEGVVLDRWTGRFCYVSSVVMAADVDVEEFEFLCPLIER